MRYLVAAAALLVMTTGQAGPTEPYVPARLVEGPAPAPPGQQIVGGGEVLLDVTIGTDGQVGSIGRLRVTPPYTDLVSAAVEDWRFSSAEVAVREGGRRKAESHVLVAAVYRPPAMYVGGSLGETPRDVAQPSASIPLPQQLAPPAYPPTARGDGTVVLEIEVGADGNPRNVRVVHSGGGFDSAAIQAAQLWSFAPARLPDGPVPAFVYVVMGFREPIAGGRDR
jgi:TonB family protein